MYRTLNLSKKVYADKPSSKHAVITGLVRVKYCKDQTTLLDKSERAKPKSKSEVKV